MLVNYETTWYPSHAAYAGQGAEGPGDIRKVVATDGHAGPKEIGVQPEFLAWLTDPEHNGAGALFDFGCYGANLMTWLMDDERPPAVTAVTQRFKPDDLPEGRRRGDDRPGVPGRAGDHPGVVELAVRPEGLEVYAERAYAVSAGADGLRVRLPGAKEETRTPAPLAADQHDSVGTWSPWCVAA